ncbi:eukaryotic translation initiation factor 2C 2 [Papiliotrema laurentii]|uniref:Eukaryotic translation initiation factor 2C 2 n=1 Tax=Papiliotrema laurentii TaxID=5418 RepID=A0AAD9CWB0_PAPLA|nr:eukaryotic translation initiation factor 2C 2 [Papiliotrema laurentii]
MSPPKGADTAHPQAQVPAVQDIFASMRVGDMLDEYHPRPDLGKAGKPIKVFANMYQARFKNQGKEANSINHYDVEINPVVKVANQKKPRQLLWAIWNQMCAEATGPLKKVLDASAYDMVKNMYTPFALPAPESGKLEVIVALKEDGQEADDDRRRFKVQFALANVIDLNALTDFCRGDPQVEKTKETMLVAVQAMNVLFRQDPTNRMRAIGAQGRRFFGTDGATPISGGGVVYNGFAQSFRFTSSGLPAIQLDTAYSAFVQAGPLLNCIGAMLGDGGGGGRGGGRGGRGGRGGFSGGGRPDVQSISPVQLRKLNEVLRMAKFTVTHRKSSRVFTMRGLTSQCAADLKFLLNGRDGRPDRMVSVETYMKEQYNYVVRKPRLPCVQYGSKFYLPMECVVLEAFNSIPFRSLTADQTADMIRVAAKPPPERKAMIDLWRGKLDYHNLPKVRAWGVEVQTKMMEIGARVLPPPNVLYGSGKTARAQFGGWNLKGLKFTRPGTRLKTWAVLSFDRFIGQQEMGGFVSQLVRVLNMNGCPVENTHPPLIQQNPDQGGQCEGIKPGLQTAARAAYDQTKGNPQLIVVILPRKDQMLYATVKRTAAEGLHKPVVTQCLQGAKVKPDARGLDQYLGNVSMKIHAKLGGVTHEVDLSRVIDKKTMIMGADVSHPPQRGGPIPPSIAVTIAATSGDNVRWLPSMRLQEGRVEIIAELADMTYSQLAKFRQNTKALPEKIIMFRDGVSEGQYSHCVKMEAKAIKDAAARFGSDYRPKLTFVICAKKHSMRFFAASDQDKDRTGNLPPGTVVDTGVTHPFAFDFYLQAHAGLQGTAKPTHYIVVKDEIGFTADKMQNLCYALSCSYARATRSVSLVPPAYYADIIATKARDLIYSDDFSDTATTLSSSSVQKSQTYDPLRLKKRLEENPHFNEVGWYM